MPVPVSPALSTAVPGAGLLDTLLSPFEFAISHVLVSAHHLLAAAGLPAAGGFTWVASVAILVVVVRSALLPLVIRQVRMAHRLAAAAPRLQQVRERYRGARDQESLIRFHAEKQAVYAEAGARPLGCLPVLAQVPVLLALFRVLDGAAHGRVVGAVTPSLVAQLDSATLAGASLADGVRDSGSASMVALALTVVMAGALWAAQRQQVTRNVTPEALDGPAGMAQRASIWLLPATAVLSGFVLPIGVLVYFACTNVWSLVQQVALIRWMPTPGSPAHAHKLARATTRAEQEPGRRQAR
jgi:YidC/Oxa1 family membrane protein insertase